MPDNQTLSLSEAAESVGVKPVTFRRWADQHGAYLSPGANPPVGQARRFDSRDLEVLRTVKAYRDQGISSAFINDKLSGMTFASVIDTEIADDTSGLGADTTELASMGTHTGQADTQALIMVVQGVESRIAAVERSQRQGYVTAIGIGICIGLLFCAILIGLAWLYGGAP